MPDGPACPEGSDFGDEMKKQLLTKQQLEHAVKVLRRAVQSPTYSDSLREAADFELKRIEEMLRDESSKEPKT